MKLATGYDTLMYICVHVIGLQEQNRYTMLHTDHTAVPIVPSTLSCPIACRAITIFPQMDT